MGGPSYDKLPSSVQDDTTEETITTAVNDAAATVATDQVITDGDAPQTPEAAQTGVSQTETTASTGTSEVAEV